VRQQQHDAGREIPLILSRADELIDDHLRAIGKSPNCASQSTSASG